MATLGDFRLVRRKRANAGEGPGSWEIARDFVFDNGVIGLVFGGSFRVSGREKLELTAKIVRAIYL